MLKVLTIADSDISVMLRELDVHTDSMIVELLFMTMIQDFTSCFFESLTKRDPRLIESKKVTNVLLIFR